MAPRASDIALARKSRAAALGIMGTMALWMLMQLIGAQYNWPPKYALLIDMLALAGMIWALAVVAQIWRARRGGSDTKDRASGERLGKRLGERLGKR